jgi:hypothetical protein
MTDPHRRTGATMLVIAWMLLFGLGYWFFGMGADRVNPNRVDKLARQQGRWCWNATGKAIILRMAR